MKDIDTLHYLCAVKVISPLLFINFNSCARLGLSAEER